MDAPTVQYPVFDDRLYTKHREPYSLTIGQPFQMDGQAVKKDGMWSVTVHIAPGIKGPVSFYFMKAFDANALIDRIRRQLSILGRQQP